MSARERFVRGTAAALGADSSLPERRGVTVYPDEERAKNAVTSGYVLGEHLVISCDPAVTDRLRVATASIEPTLEAWMRCATDDGAEHIGGALMQTLERGPLADTALPGGFELVTIDVRDPLDMARIQALIDVSSDEDLDEAELEMDNLDEIFHAVVDPDDALAAFASARPWEHIENYGDIGVLTRHDCRGVGVGKAAVVALCGDLLARDIDPLYRCDHGNAGSVRLSASIGFEIATELQAYRFRIE